jgi:hypothetical protein
MIARTRDVVRADLEQYVADMLYFFCKPPGGDMRSALTGLMLSGLLFGAIPAVCLADDVSPSSDNVTLAMHGIPDAQAAGDKDIRNVIAHVDETLENIVRQPPGTTLPPAGPVIDYKGRKLIGSTYRDANNADFFKWMKWAIDKVDQLPENLRFYPSLIRVIRFDPPSKETQIQHPNA